MAGTGRRVIGTGPTDDFGNARIEIPQHREGPLAGDLVLGDQAFAVGAPLKANQPAQRPEIVEDPAEQAAQAVLG